MSAVGAAPFVDRCDRPHSAGPGCDASDRLTDAQHDVIRRLALGHTWDRIAADLGITYHTVANHRTAALNAFDGGSTIDLFRDIGWLRVPPQRTAA